MVAGNLSEDAHGRSYMNITVKVAQASQTADKAEFGIDLGDAGVWFVKVNEAYSTQDCFECNARSDPKGLKELGRREWVCSHCGTIHLRDRNAAKNTLRGGRATHAEGIPVV